MYEPDKLREKFQEKYTERRDEWEQGEVAEIVRILSRSIGAMQEAGIDVGLEMRPSWSQESFAMVFNHFSGTAYIHETFAVKGTDVRIAILDSGLQGNHSDFSISRTIAQQCFTDGDCFEEGSGFGANNSGSAEDNNGHGTNVTGIIASNGTQA